MDDVAERGADPVTGEFDFEVTGSIDRPIRSFATPVITTGTGSGPSATAGPWPSSISSTAERFSPQVVEGVAYYLGNDSGLRHNWTDSTVVTGSCTTMPSPLTTSDPIRSVSIPLKRHHRLAHAAGRDILPTNVVAVRPEPKVPGYVSAGTEAPRHIAGDGTGSVAIEVVNSSIVPAGDFRDHLREPTPGQHPRDLLLLQRQRSSADPDGRDLRGEGIGPVAPACCP